MSAGRVPYESLVQRVNALNYSQPILSSAVEALKSADANEILEWEDKASKVAPMVHWRVPALIDDFLALKLEHGTDLEKNLYTGMTREQFVTRLLSCRPLCFFLQEDSYLLRPTSAASRGVTGMGGFEDIGTSRERPPLVLADYLSYDEMAISALVNVAVPTHFINRGGRFNEGKRDVTGEFERHGVYVACVGARFEVAGRMEWQTIMVTPMQNTAANGYGPPSPDDDAEQAPTKMKSARGATSRGATSGGATSGGATSGGARVAERRRDEPHAHPRMCHTHTPDAYAIGRSHRDRHAVVL